MHAPYLCCRSCAQTAHALRLAHAAPAYHTNPVLQDFPIMPVEGVGFMLKPFGFFKWNPTLDLPPDTNKASKQYQDPPRKALAAPPAPRPRL